MGPVHKRLSRVAIYNAYLPTLGGGELCTLALARILADRGHEVDLLTLPGVELAAAYARFGLGPPDERVRLIDLDPGCHHDEAGERSAGYELFFNLTHYSTVRNQAPRGVLWPWFPRHPASLRDGLGFVSTYHHVVTISRYAAHWLERWWKVQAAVVYPPVAPIADSGDAVRERSIIVVGRFSTHPHPKRQLELVRAFAAAVADAKLDGWTLDLVGGVSTQDEEYLEAVRAAAEETPVRLWINPPREMVVRRLSSALIAWQATGWGCDPDHQPERFEHFGIGLVEAMSAGAVPVALGIGGGAEVVRDGTDGLLWEPDVGPVPATTTLAADHERRSAMSAAARERAAAFDLGQFEAAIDQVL
jgi:glycosyltransferase involved in cell wall biosynthesis